MFKNLYSQSKKTRLVTMAVMLLLPLFVTAVAHATWVDIDLNDGMVDPNWPAGNKFYTSPSNDAGIPDNDEIKNAWVANDDNTGVPGNLSDGGIYFRMETYGSPALDPNQVGHKVWAVAAIDCNNDGDFTDPFNSSDNSGDRLIAYDPAADQGYILDPSDNLPINQFPGTWGERIGSNIEWGVQFYGYLIPSCRQVIGVKLLTYNNAASSEACPDCPKVIDETTPVKLNVPTAVGLQTFQASNLFSNSTFLVLALLAAAVVTIVAVGFWRIRHQRAQ